LTQEAVWACQSEFAAALHRVRAREMLARGLPHKACLAMAEADEQVARAIWENLAASGVSRPGCFVKQNDLSAPAKHW
jgi:hypothetical protein